DRSILLCKNKYSSNEQQPERGPKGLECLRTTGGDEGLRSSSCVFSDRPTHCSAHSASQLFDGVETPASSLLRNFKLLCISTARNYAVRSAAAPCTGSNELSWKRRTV